MKTIKLSLCLLVALLVPRFSFGDIVGNYTADANTLFLLHFDEAAGGSVTTNVGTKGGNFYSVNEATASATPPTVTTMLGAVSYLNGATNFHNCMTNPTTGYEFGYDFNKSGAYQGDVSSSSLSPDALAMTNLNIGNGGQTPFTLEALVRPNQIASGTQEIICTDSSAGSRAFQFRLNAGTVQFTFVNGGATMSGTIPTTGNDAFVLGNWYHVAFTYDGTNGIIYWTLLNPTNGAAHIISTAVLAAIGTAQGATTGPLIIGNENRNNAGEQFQGSIDEVRISSVARASGQMQFYSPLVSITQNPVSQNVDYNQPVSFSVGASSQFALGYQWRFNSNSIAGATNAAYAITNVSAANAGYYDCVVTNSIGNLATSAEGRLVVGAANFIANRYSFSASFTNTTVTNIMTPDSIGGATGTNFGDAYITNGALVLDGTNGTYMQLPGNLFNSANATALTVEFWATYGTNPNNVYPFSFGATNFVTGQGIIGFNYVIYSSHNSTGQTALSTPGDPGVSVQTVSASGNLDGRTVHVAVVVDPPNKQFSIYTNGVLEAVNTNFTVNISSLNDQLSYIGRSLYAADPYLNASIDELRIFKGALSGISIQQSDVQGPNTLLADGPATFTIQPTNTSTAATLPATFTAAAVGYLPISYQWFKNGTLVPGATNTTFTFTAAAGDNNASIVCYATNTIGITTYVTNTTTATLSVVIPPTLAWLGQNSDSWDTSTLNWTNTGTASLVPYASLDRALFNDLGSGQPTVDLTQSVNPLSVTIDSSLANYTFISSGQNGSLIGGGSLIKNNVDALVIDVTNSLTGTVFINGGILQIGNNDALGSLGTGVVSNNATLSLDRSDAALSVANAIHGTGTLSIDGTGTVTVSGANDFSGPTLVNQGILNLQNSTGLGATNGTVTVASGAELYITANVDIAPKTLVVSGSGVSGAGALRKGGAGVTAYYGPVALTADTTLAVDGGATLNLTNSAGIDGVSLSGGAANLTLSGSGTGNIAGSLNLGSDSLTVSGGTWTVAPSNDFSGVTTVSGGQLKITGPLSFGLVPGSFNASQVTLSGGSLGCSTNVTLNDGNIGINLNANATISVDTNQTLTISNQISSSSGSFALTKTGAGKLILNGANSFNGTLDVDTFSQTANDGTLVIASSAAIANISSIAGVPFISIRNQNGGSSTLGLDGTLGGITVAPDINLNGRNNSVPAIESIAGNNTISGNFTLGSGGGTYMMQCDAGTLSLTAPLPYATPGSGRTFTFAGAGGITASGGIQNGTGGVAVSVIKSGSGTLTLPVANSYTGSTTINNGVLMLNGSITSTGSVLVATGAAATLSGTGSITDNVTVQTGGTVSPGAGTNSVGVLTVSGNLTNTGTLLMDLSKSGSVLTNDTIAGIGTLQYGGSLQLVLNGSALASGDSFTLFSAGVYAGSFTNIVPAVPAPGLAWNTNSLGTSGTLSVIAGPALLLQAAPTASAITNGQPLSASILSGGSVTNSLGASVPGTFAFTTPSATPGVGTANQSVTFTPTDTATYNPFTFNVSVTVVAPALVTGLKFTASPVISGTSLTISGTNTGSGTIYLLTSTNVASPLSSWTPVWTNTTGGSGTFTTNLLNVVNPVLGRQFYILGNTN
jgi:autotransporter-associated beta strand protein